MYTIYTTALQCTGDVATPTQDETRKHTHTQKATNDFIPHHTHNKPHAFTHYPIHTTLSAHAQTIQHTTQSTTNNNYAHTGNE